MSTAHVTGVDPEMNGWPQGGRTTTAEHPTTADAPEDWEPGFVDYFYVSFTNATAFSPTDVVPLTRWTKPTMLAHEAVSLCTVGLVIARAVNILQ
jgi:uncharacterized membrane protein